MSGSWLVGCLKQSGSFFHKLLKQRALAVLVRKYRLLLKASFFCSSFAHQQHVYAQSTEWIWAALKTRLLFALLRVFFLWTCYLWDFIFTLFLFSPFGLSYSLTFIVQLWHPRIPSAAASLVHAITVTPRRRLQGISPFNPELWRRLLTFKTTEGTVDRPRRSGPGSAMSWGALWQRLGTSCYAIDLRE